MPPRHRRHRRGTSKGRLKRPRSGDSRDSRDSRQQVRDWDPPLPLSHPDVPVFPSDALPDTLREFVETEVEATQTPVDLPATMALAAVATCCANRVVVRVRQDWKEPLNEYLLTALESGSRKTQVVRDAKAPLERFEQEEKVRMGPEIARRVERRRIAERELEDLRRKTAAAKAKSKEQFLRKADDLAERVAAMDVPAPPELLADDATPEYVAQALAPARGPDSLDLGGRRSLRSHARAIQRGRKVELRGVPQGLLGRHDPRRSDRTGNGLRTRAGDPPHGNLAPAGGG